MNYSTIFQKFNSRFSFFLILILFSAPLLYGQTTITHNIGSGNLTIPGTSTNNYILTGSTSLYRVIIETGYKGTVILNNITMSVSGMGPYYGYSGYACITVEGQYNRSNLNPITKVNLVLNGTNTLTSFNPYYGAIQVNQGAQINISAIDPADDSSGILVAQCDMVNGGAAAIGAPYMQDWDPRYALGQGLSPNSCGGPDVNTSGGNIIISSGTISAQGGYHGAGIGGGWWNYYNGIIIIYGGKVESHAGGHAAGIGSGCPTGTGVTNCFADKSTIIALPPVEISATGHNGNANYGLAGAANVIYVNDPRKPLITIRTEDFEPFANIYLDLTRTPNLVEIFDSLEINYDLSKVRVGRTNAAGLLQIHGRFEQSTTFFTDASSSQPLTLGRPYLPVDTIITSGGTVILPLLKANISFTDFWSTPLYVGYSSTEAYDHAHRIRIDYHDILPMTNLTFQLQDGTDFSSLIFLAADGVTPIPTPTSLNISDTIFIVLPINQGKPLGLYSDVLLIGGNYNSIPLPGYIRRVGQQRVAFDDSYNNYHIKVTAAPPSFVTNLPTTNTVILTLNIDHTGMTGVPYVPLDVVARYVVTSEPDYNAALSANPLNTWSRLNVPLTNNSNETTTVYFNTRPSGTYYIHWYVESGVAFAHSLDVTAPPRLYGGFGPYKLTSIFARNDTVTVIKNGQILIPVKDNDLLSSSCTAIIPSISVPPPNGTATIQGDSVLYKPALNYLGKDSTTYRLICGDDTSYAKIYIKVIDSPDNIIDAFCYGLPVPQAWSITGTSSTGATFSPYQNALVGDVDRCGIPEILVCMDPVNSTVGGINRPAPSIAIFKGNNITTPWKIINTVQPYCWDHITKYGIVKTKIGGADTVLIVVAESDRYLRAYNYNGGLVWRSNVVYHSTLSAVGWNSTAPGFADFDNDSIPEIMIKGKIFNSVNGQLLCSTPTDPPYQSCVPIAADLFNTGKLNFIVGNNIYTPNATLTALTLVRTISLTINPSDPDIPAALGVRPPFNASGASSNDGGLVSAVDINNDGKLELIYQVSRGGLASPYIGEALIAVANPSNGAIMASKYIPYAPMCSWPFVGDIDGCGYPEIVFITSRANVASPNPTEQPYWLMHAYKYASGNNLLQKFWTYQHQDPSGATGMTLFDFNQDGISEIVYRDEQNLRIINGSLKDHLTGLPVTAPYNLTSIPNTSGTSAEYPVVADVDGDGQAEIVIVGGTATQATLGSLWVYKSQNPSSSPWAPTRKVWNQYAYNAAYVNEDLSIPANPINLATVFPGPDGILGTADDVRPYNNFLQQQTFLDKNGVPLWLLPDLKPLPAFSSISISGNVVTITVRIENQGEASIGSPVHYSLYRDFVTAGNKILNDSLMIRIDAGNTATFTVSIANITLYQPLVKLIVRLNDKGGIFPFTPECDLSNNEISFINPAINRLMKKDAVLNSIPHNGTLDNPVAALYSENIEYTITAVNANLSNGTIVYITDTLPAFLTYVSSTPTVIPITTGSPSRSVLNWTITGLASMATTSVKVVATPQLGSCASQPLFDNRAWVRVSDTIKVPTNYTWHQGAGVSLMTFSAGHGGSIYQATEQVLDYRTTPRAGIVIVPNDGYRFIGWSHPEYLSLRGETIPAQSGIMRYDTCTIYGHVNLKANFAPEYYPITYLLNSGENAPDNPVKYSIETNDITIQAPTKMGDVFVGWTGSNGDEPQLTVTIPHGSIGERIYFANYLISGRETTGIRPLPMLDDMMWTAKDELVVRTFMPGSILRVYSLGGVLLNQQIILQPGEYRFKLPEGIYVVTLNNGLGQKVIIQNAF